MNHHRPSLKKHPKKNGQVLNYTWCWGSSTPTHLGNFISDGDGLLFSHDGSPWDERYIYLHWVIFYGELLGKIYQSHGSCGFDIVFLERCVYLWTIKFELNFDMSSSYSRWCVLDSLCFLQIHVNITPLPSRRSEDKHPIINFNWAQQNPLTWINPGQGLWFHGWNNPYIMK